MGRNFSGCSPPNSRLWLLCSYGRPSGVREVGELMERPTKVVNVDVLLCLVGAMFPTGVSLGHAK